MKWKIRLCTVVMALAMAVPAAAFTDTQQHWAAGAISRWSEAKVLAGFEDGTFRPNDPITRAQMASLLNKIFGWNEKAENHFSDLPDSAWYTDAILRANAAGVIQGGGGLVRPQDTITRQEAAVMLYRAFGMQPLMTVNASFSDGEEIASWAREAVNTMADEGYIAGMPDGSFAPKGQLTRAQAATILNKVISQYYDWAGVYADRTGDFQVVGAPGVTLQNISAKDLLVSSAARGSETMLSNIDVSDRLMVGSGDRYTSVHLLGSSKIARLLVTGDNARVHVGEDVQIGEILISGSNADIRGLQKGMEVTVTGAGAQVNGHAMEIGTGKAGKDISGSGIDLVFGGSL